MYVYQIRWQKLKKLKTKKVFFFGQNFFFENRFFFLKCVIIVAHLSYKPNPVTRGLADSNPALSGPVKACMSVA